MSTVMNEGVNMRCKLVTYQVFTVVDLLVEISTSTEITKGYFEAYPSIRKLYVTVTSNSPVISSTSLYHYFSAVNFSITYKMYVNMGLFLGRFIIDFDVEFSM